MGCNGTGGWLAVEAHEESWEGGGTCTHGGGWGRSELKEYNATVDSGGGCNSSIFQGNELMGVDGGGSNRTYTKRQNTKHGHLTKSQMRIRGRRKKQDFAANPNSEGGLGRGASGGFESCSTGLFGIKKYY